LRKEAKTDISKAELINAIQNPITIQPVAKKKYIRYLDQEFDFGKHKGKTIETVLEEFPSYILWVSENVNTVEIDIEILNKARENAELKIFDSHKPSKSYYDMIEDQYDTFSEQHNDTNDDYPF
jgi:hypothetical protein